MKRLLYLSIISFLGGVIMAAPAQSQPADSLPSKSVSPTGALVRSALVPGWGQFYNKKYIKAGVFALGESYLIYSIATNWKKADDHKSNFQGSADPLYRALEFAEYEKYRDRRNLNLWIMAAALFYSMFDAYVDAHLADFNQSDKAFEARLEPTPDDGVRLVLDIRIR